MEGYHNFEFSPTPTAAVGVVFFLKESLDFDLLPSLKLNLNLCEDLWIKVKNVDNPKFVNKGLEIEMYGVAILVSEDIKIGAADVLRKYQMRPKMVLRRCYFGVRRHQNRC